MESNPYRPPQSQVDDVVPSGSAARQGILEIYFSFGGRVPRKVYWLYFMLPLVVAGILFGMWEEATKRSASNPEPGMGFPLFQILLIWPSLAITVKRWHDRDKSGWWILIGIIPIIGGIWALVENGFLRGTEGDNRFGADPTGVY